MTSSPTSNYQETLLGARKHESQMTLLESGGGEAPTSNPEINVAMDMTGTWANTQSFENVWQEKVARHHGTGLTQLREQEMQFIINEDPLTPSWTLASLGEVLTENTVTQLIKTEFHSNFYNAVAHIREARLMYPSSPIFSGSDVDAIRLIRSWEPEKKDEKKPGFIMSKFGKKKSVDDTPNSGGSIASDKSTKKKSTKKGEKLEEKNSAGEGEGGEADHLGDDLHPKAKGPSIFAKLSPRAWKKEKSCSGEEDSDPEAKKAKEEKLEKKKDKKKDKKGKDKTKDKEKLTDEDPTTARSADSMHAEQPDSARDELKAQEDADEPKEKPATFIGKLFGRKSGN